MRRLRCKKFMRVARYLLGFGGRLVYFDFWARTYGLGNFRAFPLAVASCPPSSVGQSALSSLFRSGGDRLLRQPGRRRFILARGVISATRRLWRPCVQYVSDAPFHQRETLLLSPELGLTWHPPSEPPRNFKHEQTESCRVGQLPVSHMHWAQSLFPSFLFPMLLLIGSKFSLGMMRLESLFHLCGRSMAAEHW